jgi:hypothetical protein
MGSYLNLNTRIFKFKQKSFFWGLTYKRINTFENIINYAGFLS